MNWADFNKLAAVAFVASCAAFATGPAAAVVLDQSSPEYMGYIDDGIPAGTADEEGYVDFLADMVPGTTDTDGSETYDRSTNVLCYNTCADAEFATKDEGGNNTGDFGSGYLYLLAKYDGPNFGDVVWYVEGLTGEFELPTNLGGRDNSQYGISHWSLFNGTPTTTPEPSTLGLFGLGLLGVAWMVRRRNAQRFNA